MTKTTKVTDALLRKLVSIDQHKTREIADLPYAGFGTAVAMEGSCFDVAAVNKLLRKPLASTR